MKIVRTTCCFLVLALFCCRKPYAPRLVSTSDSYLVVEGVINPGSDSTIIKLSKTVKVNNKTALNPLFGAIVTVESDQSGTWNLTDFYHNGNYASAGLNLSVSAKYRLRINTSDGRQYLSDFIGVNLTPPIDSVGFKETNQAVQWYVSTHDPAGSTHYYRWDYDETWIFHSTYQSDWVLDSATQTIVQRRPDQLVYYCYGNDHSTNILLTSTANLSQDVIFQRPLANVLLSSEKVMQKYSILVRQYRLSADAYKFYQNLANSTEHLGTLFDAQPTQIAGNIHSLTDPSEPVIGYVTATNVQSKRIFITADVLKSALLTIYPEDCNQDTALYKNSGGINEVENFLTTYPVNFIPTSAIGGDVPPRGFLFSRAICVDCTLRGTTKTPSFWK